MDETRYPLNKLVKRWCSTLRLAKKFKDENFQRDADIAMKFFVCGRELNDLLWRDRLRHGEMDEYYDDEKLPAPRFRILVGKTAEFVQLFGPSLYHRNPSIIVEPKTPDIPIDLLMQLVPPEMIQQAQMAAQQQGQQFSPESLFPPDPNEAENKVTARLLQYYLDYMQRENDKKTHSRRAIDEALIKGEGLLWTEMYQPYPNGPQLIGSFYDTVDNLVFDPDADTFDEAKWIARRCVHPIWEVAEKYSLDEEFLRSKYATYESAEAQETAIMDTDADRKRQVGESNDLIEYWEIYSKMGMGHRLKGYITRAEDTDEFLDTFGDNCRIVIAEKVPFPLNLPQKRFKKALRARAKDPEHEYVQDTEDAVRWPIPFWADGSWPCTPLMFHEVPNNPWPMSHLKPGLGYLEFLTWGLSFLVNRVRTSCRTLLGIPKSMDEESRAKLGSGRDFEYVEVPDNLVKDGDINKIVHFLDVPQAHVDVWKVLDAVADAFDKATGLTELMYASPGGMRSAQEASLKQGALQIRPDDMANKVEDWASAVARKEAMAARWLLEREDVEPVLGKRCAALWEQYVMSGDIDKVAREFHYRVEAGSTRKPNKETRVNQINQALQQWAPLVQWSLANLSANPDAVKILNTLLSEWGEAMDMETKTLQFGPPPPPPPNPMQQKLEAELEMQKQESGLKQQEMQAKLQMEQQRMQMQLQGQQAKTQADVQKAQADMAINAAKAQQDMEIARMQTLGDLQLQGQQIGMKQQEMQMSAAQKRQEMEMGAAQQAQQMQMSAQQHEMGMRQQAAEGVQKVQQQAESHKKAMSEPAAQPAKKAAKRKPKGRK